MQLRRQAVEACGDISPIRKPIARNADTDLRAAKCAFADTATRNRAGLARAACEKLLGIVEAVDEVLPFMHETTKEQAHLVRTRAVPRGNADKSCASARAAAARRPKRQLSRIIDYFPPG